MHALSIQRRRNDRVGSTTAVATQHQDLVGHLSIGAHTVAENRSPWSGLRRALRANSRPRVAKAEGRVEVKSKHEAVQRSSCSFSAALQRPHALKLWVELDSKQPIISSSGKKVSVVRTPQNNNN